MDQVWANRAASAEAAVASRHLSRLWGLPGTQLGIIAWPPSNSDRRFKSWHYWWQAHLLDLLVDAQVRDPKPERESSIGRQIRGHWLRNNGHWPNHYYDDMAWLALALERAARLTGVRKDGALRKLYDQLYGAWVPEDGGGIPWRKSDQFFNAPANGPAGILFARHGDRLARAVQVADWIDATLLDPETHLIFDGVKAGSLVRAQYTYCQGVVVGLETELAVRTGEEKHAARARRLIAAINAEIAPGGVLQGAGGGDGGLFAGITARYLALAATTLPGDTAADEEARKTAADIVLSSAGAAWDNRQTVAGLPLFGPFWDRSAEMPSSAAVARFDGPEGDDGEVEFVIDTIDSSTLPERDLSVQLGGWMLMEAACTVSGADSDDAPAAHAPDVVEAEPTDTADQDYTGES